ncbi:MAG: DUF5667 domain-containing protein [Anaerolineales bacterium]
MDERKRASQLDRTLAAKQQNRSAVADGRGLDPELLTLLMQAEQTRQALEPEGPSQTYVAATRTRVLNRVKARVTRSRRRPSAAPSRRWLSSLRRPAFALASLVLALALLLTGTGVAYAASGSLPGDPLYGVKLGLEKARLALTFQERSRVQLLNQFTNRRLMELQTMQQSGRTNGVDAGLQRYGESLDDLVGELQKVNGPGEYQGVVENMQHHTDVLQGLLETAPAGAQSGLQNAIQKSTHSRSVIQAIQSSKSPSEMAPGQLKKTLTPDDLDGDIPPGQLKKTETAGEAAGDNVPPGQAKKDQTPGPPPGRGNNK